MGNRGKNEMNVYILLMPFTRQFPPNYVQCTGQCLCSHIIHRQRLYEGVVSGYSRASLRLWLESIVYRSLCAWVLTRANTLGTSIHCSFTPTFFRCVLCAHRDIASLH
jgi:hypothetical protein